MKKNPANTLEVLSTFHDFTLLLPPERQHHSNWNDTGSTCLSERSPRSSCWLCHGKGSFGVRGCRYKKTTLTVFSELIQSLLKTTGIFLLVLTGSGLGSALLILKRSPVQLSCYLLHTGDPIRAGWAKHLQLLPANQPQGCFVFREKQNNPSSQPALCTHLRAMLVCTPFSVLLGSV